MGAPRIDPQLVERLHRTARAERWGVSAVVFSEALERSLAKAPAGAKADVERYLTALHLEDLALACACAAGDEGAWDHFIRAHRPLLYRTADALAPGGGARDIADGLYGELFGLREGGGERQSLFRYFHGRSSLATWVRAVLAQRFVDRVRAERRLEPLPDDDTIVAPAAAPDPDRRRVGRLFQHAMAAAIARLAPRDRLRLSSYYAEDLTLAQIGRLLGEHEATVSRHLAKTRRVVREDVEQQLEEAGLSPDEVEECFDQATEDAGELDLAELVRGAERKNSEVDRST